MKQRLMTIVAVGAVVVALCHTRPLAAQMAGAPSQHLIRIGFGGGMTVPTSHAADVLKSGVNGQAYLLLNPGIPLRFNLGYQKFNFKDAVLAGEESGDTRMLSGVGALQIDLLRGPVRPYIIAGVGAFNVKNTMTGVPDETSTHFGIDGGAGLTLKLGRLDAFIEGRVQNVYTERGAIDAKSIQSVPVTFGILF